MSASSSPTAKLGRLRERVRRKFGNRAPSPPSSTPPPISVSASPTAHSPGSSSTQALSASPLSASPFIVHSPNTTTALSPSQQLIPNLSFDLFEEALKLLSDGDRTIIRKYTLPTASEIDLALVQAITAAKVKQQRCIERRWTFTFAGREVIVKDEADKVVHWLNRFKSVGDIVVNVDPMHAGLPWAGIRLLLEVTVSEANQMTSLLVGCETALYMANRLKAYTSFLQGLPATLSRTNFETHLTKLYAHIFQFLAQALKIYETSTFERAFKAFWNVSNVQDFTKSCNELGQQLEIEASNCDRTLSAQDRTRVGELKIDLRNVLEGLEQFHKIQDSLDRIEMNYCLNNLLYAQGAMFDSYGNTRTTCHPETRVDLLRRIQSWAQEPESKHIFWLNGMAGVGKSTISQTFAKWLTKQDDPQTLDLGASFFFKRNEGDRGSALRFFPTIVRQLVVKLPGLDTLVADVIKHDPLIFDKSLGEQFNKLLKEPLQKINSSNGGCLTLVLVVDALDECGSKSTPSSSDIEVLLRLWSQLSQPETVRLKLFLTSRPDLPTQLGFKEMSIDDYQDIVLHSEKEVPPATIRHDILAFLNDEFSKIRKKYNTRLRSGAPLEDTWPSDNVLQELVDMAIPLFIVAATVCIYVGDFRRHSPGKRLERILGFQKQGQLAQLQQLGQTYLPVLTQQEGTFSHADEENEYYENFRRIVGSIVVLAEPLSIASLADLLGLEQNDISRCLDDLRSVLHIPDDSEIPVRALHLSFSEFLLSDELRDRPFRVDGPATHQLLSNKCLELLSHPGGLRKNICNLTYEGQPRSEVDSTVVNQHLSPALQYACKYWVHHTQRSETQVRDNDQVHEFLKTHFLNWLEALSLMGRITEAIGHIRVLQSLTAPNASNYLSLFLEDARRIVLAYRYITDLAPLQIYSSAMIFAPQNSVVRNVCYQIPRWIQKCPITPPIWGTELQTLEGHSHSVNSVAFSHDSKLLASASRDNTVKIWDTSTGSLQQTLEGHSDWVTSVAFSHDSKLLASASRDKTVKIWDTSTGSLQQTVRVNSYIWTLLFDSTDSSLITDIGLIKGSGKSNYEGLSVSGSWVVWNAQNLLWLPPNYRGPDIAVSPSCSTVAIGCQSGKVVVIGFSLVTLHNS